MGRRVLPNPKCSAICKSTYIPCPVTDRPKSMEIALSASNNTVPADLAPVDPSPSLSKVWQDVSGEYVIANSEGLRLGVRWRFDNRGYDVSNSTLDVVFLVLFLADETVGPHRVRPGQNVIVTDPKMSRWLPIPASSLVPELEPMEVMLRFSSEGQVFLHALGATATFGRSFAKSGDGGWGFGGGEAMALIKPGIGQGLACTTVQPIERDQPFVLMLERGGCTFLEKLVHGTRAGASGVIVIGYPPDPSGAQAEEGLIRPSAEGEPGAARKLVEGSGMVYVEHMIGEVVGRILERSGLEVKVEVIRLDDDGSGGEEMLSGGSDRNVEGEGDWRREGKLALGEWEIWNLRIVEIPP